MLSLSSLLHQCLSNFTYAIGTFNYIVGYGIQFLVSFSNYRPLPSISLNISVLLLFSAKWNKVLEKH